MSMAHVRALLATVMVMVALGIPAMVFAADTAISGKFAPDDPTIKTLDGDAVLVIQLYETPKGGAEGEIRRQQTSVGGSSVPTPFSISGLTPNSTSSYRMVLSLGHSPSRKMDFQSSFAVLNNNQLPTVFTLKKMPGTLPILSGGGQRLLLGLLLAGLAGLVTVWRWQRRRIWSLQRA